MFVKGEAKDALEDVFLKNEQVPIEATLQSCIAKLNSDQFRVFSNVVDLMKHFKKQEDSACSCGQLHLLQMFLSGVGGTGKSFLIHTIQAQIADMEKHSRYCNDMCYCGTNRFS